jgi:phosphoribosyl 1,2-cyclic phosphodiesterase
VRGCQLLALESNHDLDMLKVGPYPWFVKQRVMSRVGHLSNHAVSEFLASDFDQDSQILVLAHLSEHNNHPEIARLTALDALRSAGAERTRLVLAEQRHPSEVFQF